VQGKRRRLGLGYYSVDGQKEKNEEKQDEEVSDFWKRMLQNGELDSMSAPLTSAPTAAPVAEPSTVAPIISTEAPTPVPIDSPTATPTKVPITAAPITSTEAPTPATVDFPTAIPTTASPDTAGPTVSTQPSGIQLCSGNLPVTVVVGPNSNPAGGFVNVNEQQSLANVIDCLDINEGETHTQASHVWWNPAPLELIFDFGQEFSLRSIHFWNYFGEGFDVDQIDFVFFNSLNETTGTFTVEPRTGEKALGQNNNPIVAETLPLPAGIQASRVAATLTSSNGELDFQNFVFRSD